MPKLCKDDARDISGVHTTIVQPFALLDSIELSRLVVALPHFLPDSDALTHEVQALRVWRSAAFLSIDIRQLYPSIDLRRCLAAVWRFQMDSLPVGASAAAVEVVELAAELWEITLLENFCFFGGKFYKFHRGFPTGIASGRELVEIYLHMVEAETLGVAGLRG